MDQIFISSNKIPSITAIHNSFIKSYMLEANGSYVKVYLYLSMCLQSGNDNFSISSLADQMDNTEKDILRALKYWEKKGIVALKRGEDGKEIIGIEFLTPGQAETPSNAQEITMTNLPAKEPILQPIPQQMPQQVSVSSVPTDTDFTWICQIVEKFLERPISSAEVNFLTYLYETAHFSKDLILHLYEYCCNLGKTNVKYVEKVALSWAEKGIKTPEEAAAYSTQYSSSHTAVSKALGLGRALAGIECAFVDRWQYDWQMDLAVILEACNRTMLTIQKADFKYTDAILSKWHAHQVRTLADMKAYDEAYAKSKSATGNQNAPRTTKKTRTSARNQFQSFQQRDVSQQEIDELEKLLLSK